MKQNKEAAETVSKRYLVFLKPPEMTFRKVLYSCKKKKKKRRYVFLNVTT